MLFEAPIAANDKEREILAELERLKQLVASSFSPRRWFGSLRRLATAKAIQASIGIEGFLVSVEDALAAVEQEEPLDAKDEERAALVGYREALTLILQRAEDEHFRYSAEFLKALHYMMVSHDLRARPGLWRQRPIFVADSQTQEIVYEAPPYGEVSGLMQELIDELNAENPEVHPVVRAAMAHLNFVMIHPHSDGNGRMGRALQTLVLTREWETRNPIFTSIEQYLGGKRTQEYYAVLAKVGRGHWSPSTDTGSWIDFCLTAHYRQAKHLHRTGIYFERLYGVLEEEVRRAGLPDRCLGPVVESSIGLRIVNGTYRKAADVSAGTASRDLAALVQAGLLLRKGAKRGSYYIASPKTAGIADKVEKPKPVEDPFRESMVEEQSVLFS